MRILYCRLCDEAYVSDAGKVPSICPACQRTGRWTTQPPAGIRPSATADAEPVTAYALTRHDRALLWALAIAAD